MESIQQKHVSFKELMAYSFGLFGLQLIIGYSTSYQAEFYASILGAGFEVIGILIPVVKILSALFDPVIGNWIDRSNSEKGKLRPFILYSLVPVLVLSVILFIKVPLTGAALYVYIFVTFLLWSMALTLGDVPSQAYASVLTPNPTERTTVVSISNTFKSMGLSAAMAVIPFICILIPGGSRVLTKNDSPISYREYLVTGIFVAVAGTALLALIAFFNKERVPYKAEKMSLREMLQSLKANDQLMLVVLSCFLGFGRTIQTAITVQAANAILGSQNLPIVLGFSIGIGAMVSMACMPAIIKKLDEKRAYIFLSVLGFVMSLAAFFAGTKNYPLMLILLFLLGLQFGVNNLMPPIMVTDCVDYYEYKTGRRTAGSAFATLSLTVKITLALSTGLGLILIRASGYDPNAAVYAESTKSVIYFAYAALPGVFSLLSALPIFKYKLYGKTKLDIAAELEKRRGHLEMPV